MFVMPLPAHSRVASAKGLVTWGGVGGEITGEGVAVARGGGADWHQEELRRFWGSCEQLDSREGL